jgi:hypothetical protein
MPFPDSAEQAKLISNARARASASVQAFVDGTGERELVAVSCERASLAVDHYCEGLLKQLICANPPTTQGDTAWLKSRYLTLIVEFGSAIRDALQDSETRHAAAQGIQFRVLEHERQLRITLQAASIAHSPTASMADSPTVEIKRETPPGTPPSQQKSYLSQTDVSPETV